MADYLRSDDGWLRIDLGLPTTEADPPPWLNAHQHGRGPILQGTPYNWLPRNATAEVYGEIAAYAYAHKGPWWDALHSLANHAQRATEEGCLFGYPKDWLVTPSKRVPGTCSCCGKQDGHFPSACAGHPAIVCENCGEMTFDPLPSRL